MIKELAKPKDLFNNNIETGFVVKIGTDFSSHSFTCVWMER
jgi:hypothetical protein